LSAPARATVAPRLRATGLAVLGLLSFWTYTAWKVRGAVDALAAARGGVDLPTSQRWMPGAALAAFASSALLVALWWTAAMVLGVEPHAPWLLTAVALSSLAFWCGLALLLLWLLQALEAIEAAAAFAARGPFDDAAAEAFAQRWEQQTSRVTLYLVIALPCVASPTLATWAWGSGRVDLEQAYLMLAAVFVAALVVHAWGTALLLRTWNGHLADARATASGKSVPAGAPSIGAANLADGEAPPRQLAAIMLTDMVGYSRGMERDETGAYRKLQLHNEIVRRDLAAHRGREIKTIGDAFLVLFASAQDAVTCALSIQRAFAEYNTTREGDDRIMIRIGVHLGDVIVTKDDVFGDGVNVAARIEPLAEPGGVCISDAVYMSVRKHLSVEVDRVDDSGVKLKNISMRPDLYRLRIS
jgi:class 3 adenylate cyclase